MQTNEYYVYSSMKSNFSRLGYSDPNTHPPTHPPTDTQTHSTTQMLRYHPKKIMAGMIRPRRRPAGGGGGSRRDPGIRKFLDFGIHSDVILYCCSLLFHFSPFSLLNLVSRVFGVERCLLLIFVLFGYGVCVV